MSVEKTYSITIKYEKDTAGLVTQKGDIGETGTIPVLAESDPEYTEIQKKVLSAIQGTIPLSQGIVSAHIVVEVSET